MIIIVAGLAGSGKSTLADSITKELGLKCVHASGILRELAEKEIGHVDEGTGRNEGWWEGEEGRKYLQKRLSDGSMDRAVDKKLLEIIKEGDVVLDSWTMPWLSKKGFKIWLETPLKERAIRVAGRDNLPEDKVYPALKERDEKTAQIYKKLYGFELGKDFKVFDLVLDTNGLSSGEVFEKAMEVLREKGMGK